MFRDASADWGTKELGAVGVRMNAVDFDGDGWTDLAVRSGNDPDDFAAGTRSAWLLRNTGNGSFEDVTEASGIRAVRGGGGATRGRRGPVWVWADVDNDGDLDVYTGVTYDLASEDTGEVMLNDGAGHFELGPKTSSVRETVANPYGAAFTDYDLDGVVDLWTSHYAIGSPVQDVLHRGRGDGGFTDRTEAAGLITLPWTTEALNAGIAHSNAWSAAACDLNDDGWPELLASSYGRAPNHLWLNGGGTFTNRSVASGYAWDHRQDWTDNESARCWCTLHPTDEDCAGVPAPTAIACNVDEDAFRWDHTSDREPYRLGGNSGATACRDVDNDGRVDLLTTEIVHWDVGSSSDPSELLFNTGEPEVRFERPGNEVTGLVRTHDIAAWNDGDITGGTVDFDNDGWPDVYVGSSDYPSARGWLWHQTAARQFEVVPPDDGIDHMRSHGVVVADFDRDGDLDVVVGHSTARCDEDCYPSPHVRLFENLSEPGNFVQVKLRGDGTASNAAAIGAKVAVTAGGVTQVQHVSGGYGQWGSQDDLVLHFGLGSACEAQVTVTWPDAARSTTKATLQGGYRWELARGGGPKALLP